MRRVVVTPTFAAGLGVVVAAVLAYPMQTVFSYVAPGALGQGGLRCGQDGCSRQPPPTGKPEPFGAAGGALNPAPPASAKPATEHDGTTGSSAPAGPSGQQMGTGGTAVAQPRLSYKITSKWQGGFWGQITITFPGDVPANWHLRFGYPGGYILGMNPDSHLAPNGHAAVVRSSDYATGSGPDGRTFAIGVGVQGVPTHPARCSFNGQACHIG
jgi:cellulose binding protein with CBM2 domain